MEDSKKQNIFIFWMRWHFLEMPDFLFGVWKNYILFALNYFSLQILLKSLFSPWRKYKWNYSKGLDISEFFSTFFSNMFSRLLGALMRISLIIIGIFFQIFVIITGLTIILLWIFIPLIIIIGFLFVLFYQNVI